MIRCSWNCRYVRQNILKRIIFIRKYFYHKYDERGKSRERYEYYYTLCTYFRIIISRMKKIVFAEREINIIPLKVLYIYIYTYISRWQEFTQFFTAVTLRYPFIFITPRLRILMYVQTKTKTACTRNNKLHGRIHNKWPLGHPRPHNPAD